MKQEITEVPITLGHVRAIEKTAHTTPKKPLVIPITYGAVTSPGSFLECLNGALSHPQGAVLLDDRTVKIGPSHLTPDEYGQITDGIYTGITVESLLESIPGLDLTLWALHLNLADPQMPGKFNRLLQARRDLGLVAIVTPETVSQYMRALERHEPSIYRP